MILHGHDLMVMQPLFMWVFQKAVQVAYGTELLALHMVMIMFKLSLKQRTETVWFNLSSTQYKSELLLFVVV